MSMSSSATAYVSMDLLYFTFTEFPEWYGGEIIHDPAYSSVTALPTISEETSTMHTSTIPIMPTTTTTISSITSPTAQTTIHSSSMTSTKTSIPPTITSGFSLILILMIILPVLTLLRRRKNE